MSSYATVLPRLRSQIPRVLKRYGPLEISGFITAIIAGWIASKLGAPRGVIAITGTLGENIGYYGLAAYIDYRKLHRREAGRLQLLHIVQLAGGLMLEFGPAEALDTLLIRPVCMYQWGTASGKFIADGIFYAVVLATWLATGLYRNIFLPNKTQATEEIDPMQTPYLMIDLDVITERAGQFMRALPGINIRYAMKCNSDPRLLRHIHEQGIGFEIASAAELQPLLELGIDPAEVLFSNPAKSPADIAEAYRLGVRKFAFDSRCELEKLARHPKILGYLRLQTSAADSDVPSEGKFGVPLRHLAGDDALDLILAARGIGIDVWGLGFHVGSQMTKTEPWTEVIGRVAGFLQTLQNEHGIVLRMINIGGGFPAYYRQTVPPLTTYGRDIAAALKQLPYDMDVYCEPGRGLVADAGVMVATVNTIASRDGITWVHLDVGAFNGFMESLETNCALQYPVTDSRDNIDKMLVRLTGPSCDSQDTILMSALVSRSLAVGDTVYIQTAGAYTVSYASAFNGFRIPDIRFMRHR